MIQNFSGNYRFLSNFWRCKVYYDNHWFPSVECAYQYAKCFTDSDKLLLLKVTDSFESKKLGNYVALRSDWDSIRLWVMENLVSQKFSNFPLDMLLLSTGEEELVEGNTWHDNFWGNCVCPACENITGFNNLGKILTKTREGLHEKD